MKYDLSQAKDLHEAFQYLTELGGKEALVEVKHVRKTRSLNQNNYLYLLLGAFATNFGYTIEETKIIFKREVNPSIFVYEKNGQKFLRSTADLDTAEMTQAIDRFREYSSDNGLELPLATNEAELRSIENAMERSYHYL